MPLSDDAQEKPRLFGGSTTSAKPQIADLKPVVSVFSRFLPVGKRRGTPTVGRARGYAAPGGPPHDLARTCDPGACATRSIGRAGSASTASGEKATAQHRLKRHPARRHHTLRPSAHRVRATRQRLRLVGDSPPPNSEGECARLDPRAGCLRRSRATIRAATGGPHAMGCVTGDAPATDAPAARRDPTGPGWAFELKFDGIRAQPLDRARPRSPEPSRVEHDRARPRPRRAASRPHARR